MDQQWNGNQDWNSQPQTNASVGTVSEENVNSASKVNISKDMDGSMGNPFETNNSTHTEATPIGNDNLYVEYTSAPGQEIPPYQNNYYVQPIPQYTPPQNDTSKDGLCMASFILGIVGFFINPIYIVSILAIVFGAIGQGSQSVNADKAKVGLILGIASIALQIVADLIITVCTFGMGGISFCC